LFYFDEKRGSGQLTLHCANEKSVNGVTLLFCLISAQEECAKRNVNYTANALDWERPGIGQMALYMFLEGLILLSLVLLIEVSFY